MSVARTAFRLASRASFRTTAPRAFATVSARRAEDKKVAATDPNRKTSKYDPATLQPPGKLIPFDEVKTMDDLFGPGAQPGTVPTDLEQATGLERLEILGKMQGIDIFDMKPLPSDRKGTFEDPIVVKSAGEELQCGCTGSPADSHHVRWCVVSRDRPYERCDECGSVYKMQYVGPEDDPHHAHHGYKEPLTMADYVKEDYWYR